MLKKMKKLVRDKDVCVLATVTDNVPHCSLMSYLDDRDCRSLPCARARAVSRPREKTLPSKVPERRLRKPTSRLAKTSPRTQVTAAVDS